MSKTRTSLLGSDHSGATNLSKFLILTDLDSALFHLFLKRFSLDFLYFLCN